MTRGRIALVYLGRMGAGSKLTHTLAKQLIARGIEVKLVLASHNIDLPLFIALNTPLHLVNLPSRRLFAILPLPVHESVKISFFLGGTFLVYFPMPHPRDNQVIREIKLGGATVGRGIHDFVRHPGDIWPNRTSIILQKRYSCFLVAHSYFVGEKLSSNKVIVLPLPSLPANILYRPERGLVVFVGRLRKYKGLNLLIDAWKIVSQKDSTSRLFIAGDGHLKIRKLQESITLDRRWLSDSEIYELVSRANCVVFPYIEASQSGMIPILNSLKIPLVVTDVGGLSEQVSESTSLVVKPLAQEIAAAIFRAICEWKPLENHRLANENSELAEFLIDQLFRTKTANYSA